MTSKPLIPYARVLRGQAGQNAGFLAPGICLNPTKYKGLLPAEGFLKEGNRQLALGLQRGLIELFEQIEQRAHAAGATGEDKVPDLVGEVQAATGSTQLQGTQFVLVGQWADRKSVV